jgi:aminopeptidase N
LYNWHPEVAVYEKGGWLLNPVSDQGDPTNTDAANYQVTFAAPQEYTVITSGLETGTQSLTSGEVPDTQTAHTSVAALARNFVVVASDQFERSTRQVGGTSVSSYYLRDSKTGGEVALDTTVKSLEIFGAAFGSYPYAEMDIAQVDLQGAAGMESTGLIMIGSDLYGSGGNPLGGAGGALPGVEGANALVFTTAHEAAHQWWYSVVGSDAYTQPWLDESLTNWSSAYYVDQAAGKEAGALARDMFIGFSYRSTLANGDQRLDQPVDQFEEQAYGGIVYGKGALMYDVLRQELGDDTFFEFLQRYYREQQFDRADSDEWLQTLNTVAGKDMTPFYQKWVEGTSIQADDLPQGGALSNILGGLENVLPGASTAP